MPRPNSLPWMESADAKMNARIGNDKRTKRRIKVRREEYRRLVQSSDCSQGQATSQLAAF